MNIQARSLAEHWTEKWYGFWADEAALTGIPFTFDRHVDRDWNPEDKNLLVRYLNSSPIAVVAPMQNVKCGYCDEKVTTSCYRSDGELLWPDSLGHLIEKHFFVLPEVFVLHIRLMKYIPPSSVSVAVETLPWPK